MEIIPGRMVHLGYSKFWRSDDIVGLRPIEEERGPGRRTEVFVRGKDAPIVASRTERTILEDLVHLPAEEFEAEEARALLKDLAEDLSDVPRVLRRLLANEVGIDLDAWERRISAVLARDDPETDDGQEDLFTGSD